MGGATQCTKIPAITSGHGDVISIVLGGFRVRMLISSDTQYLAPSPSGFMTTTRKIHVYPSVRAPRATFFLWYNDHLEI